MSIVDLHAHYSPKEYYDVLMRIGGRSLPEAARGGWAGQALRTNNPNDLPERFERMKDADVRLQVLSPAASPPYAEKQDDAVEAARVLNDAYADLVKTHPGQLAAFVSLPLPHIDASLREMARGLDELGMIGVNINCSALDQSTADKHFEPLYEEMDRRGAVCFYHPVQNGLCSPFLTDYNWTVPVGASMEDTIVVLHLIGRHIPTKYPNIKYVIPHLGGLIPMQLERLDNQGPAASPGPAGAAQRHGQAPVLRHGRPRFAGRVLLRLPGLRGRPPRGGF